MVFNSLEFAVFFPVVTLLYFSIPHHALAAVLAGQLRLLHGFHPKLYSDLGFHHRNRLFRGNFHREITGADSPPSCCWPA